MSEGSEIEREARPPGAARRRHARTLLAVALVVLLAREARAGQEPEEEAPAPLGERWGIARNQFLSAETLRFYISTKPGDRFDQLRLREDFRRLWDTGF